MKAVSFASTHCAPAGVFEFSEGRVRYRELVLAGIIDMPAALTWKNARSLAFRAPVTEFDKWRPAFDAIRLSVHMNPQWVLRESEGQRERAEMATRVFDEMRRIDQEIVAGTARNREEIMNDNFLVLTGREEFVDPHTGDVELDTDAYRYRWKTDGGDVYYSNREDDDPNLFMQRTDYVRSPVRKRRND